MPIINIDNEQWYPVHVLDEDGEVGIMVTEEESKRIKDAFKQFSEVQELIYQRLPKNKRG